MNKSIINVKTDRILKLKAQKTAKEMGLSLGTIINHYLRKLVLDKKVVFSVPLIPNTKTGRLLDKIDRDIDKGINLSPAFSNAKDAISWLESDED